MLYALHFAIPLSPPVVTMSFDLFLFWNQFSLTVEDRGCAPALT